MRRHCAERARGGNHRPHGFIEANQSDGVTLANEQEGERRAESLTVGKLRQPPFRARPRHGSADIEHDAGAEVGLLLELLHDPAVGTGGNLPVDVPEVVPGLVGAMLGKFHGKPLSG
jgi:hypothetical protein